MRHFHLLADLAIASTVSAASCASGFTLCSPSGATSAATPQIGSPEFPSFFVNIVQSSLPSSSGKRSSSTSATTPSLCCNSATSCLLLSSLFIPFCYDRFTTNYLFPDGSFGTVSSGSYTSGAGNIANLISGDFTLVNGQKGNIYSSPDQKPNTATLPLPSQFTASGVGAAIPAASLGSAITLTYTTTLPGTTIPASIVPPSTVPEKTTEITVVLPTTISGTLAGTASISTTTVPGSVLPGTTISGKTLEGQVTVVTTTKVVTASGSASASPTPKNNGGDRVGRAGSYGFLGMALGLVIGLW